MKKIKQHLAKILRRKAPNYSVRNCSVDVPPAEALKNALANLCSASQPVEKILSANESGVFEHPETAEVVNMENAGCSRQEVGLMQWLASRCPSKLTVEVGFGVGTTCSAILASRSCNGPDFKHVVIDPGCMGGKTYPILRYLQSSFEQLQHLEKPSHIGLANIIEDFGQHSSNLIFIDGGHRFDNKFTDFMLADFICAPSGIIAFDDAPFPAIESVISYVKENRPDYSILDLAVGGVTLFEKIGDDKRPWDDFKPFHVPRRSDWSDRRRRWRWQSI